MKIWKVYYSDVVVGIVVDKDGSHSLDEVLTAWNNANPNYAGDSAASGPFLEI